MSDEKKEEKPSQEVSEKAENKEEVKPEVKNKVHKITRTLPCKFTEQEHKEATDELLDLLEDKDKLEQDKSDLVKSYGNQIRGIEEQITEKAAIVRSGVKNKPVECEWRFNDPHHGRKSLWRLDENKIIDSEDMDLLDSGTVEDEKEEKAKPGDNGKVFVFKDGREAPIFDYEDVKDEKLLPVNKIAMSAKSVLDYKLPETPFRLIRGKKKDGKTVTYFIDLLPVPAESPEPEKAPANAPEEKKPDTQAQAQNISLFLAKHNLSVAEVETLLRQEKRLGISTSLQTTATAVKYVMDNIEDIKEALKKTA